MKVPNQKRLSPRKPETPHIPIIAARSIMPYANRTMTEWCETECARAYANDPIELRRCLNECRSGSMNY
jgi:hypothetical protein